VIEARVLFVADAMEDLTAQHIHKNALLMDEALAVIRKHSGARYDPDVVNACLRLLGEKGYEM